MPRFLTDTSSMIAVLCGWHTHHDQARREVDVLLTFNQRQFLSPANGRIKIVVPL